MIADPRLPCWFLFNSYFFPFYISNFSLSPPAQPPVDYLAIMKVELSRSVNEAVKDILTSSNNISLEDQDKSGNWNWIGLIASVSLPLQNTFPLPFEKESYNKKSIYGQKTRPYLDLGTYIWPQKIFYLVNTFQAIYNINMYIVVDLIMQV